MKTASTLLLIALSAPMGGCDAPSHDELRSHEIVGLGGWTEDGRHVTHLRIDGAERLVVTADADADAPGPIVVASVDGMPIVGARPDADGFAHADFDAPHATERLVWSATMPTDVDPTSLALIELVEDGELDPAAFRIGLASNTRPSLRPWLACVLEWAWYATIIPESSMPSLADWCG